MLLFIPALGEIGIPDLLGGCDSIINGRVLRQAFFNNGDWPTVTLMLLLLNVPIPRSLKLENKQCEGRDAQLAAGTPAVAHRNFGDWVNLSVNANPDELFVHQRQAGQGTSRRIYCWYSELGHDSALIGAVGLSFSIAVASATAAVELGANAAAAMVHFGRSSRSTDFAFMLTAPLRMPYAITGLSLPLLFGAMGYAFSCKSERGLITTCLARVSFCTT